MAFLAGAAAGVMIYDALSPRGTKLSISTDVFTDMSVNSVFQSETSCFQDVTTSQNISVTETPGYTTGTAGCAECHRIMSALVKKRLDMEETARDTNFTYVPQRPTGDLLRRLDPTAVGGGAPPVTSTSTDPLTGINACDLVCRSVVVSNLRQDIYVEAKSDCTVSNDVSTTINQKLSGKIESELKNQQDIFGQFGDALAATTTSLSTSLSSAISQNLTQRFVQSLVNRMSAMQDITIGGPGNPINSAYIVNVSQALRGKQVGTMTVTNTVTNELRQSAEYSIAQSLLNKNDTTGDLVNALLGIVDDVTTLLSNIVTNLLLIMAAGVICVAAGFGIRYLLDPGTRISVRNVVR